MKNGTHWERWVKVRNKGATGGEERPKHWEHRDPHSRFVDLPSKDRCSGGNNDLSNVLFDGRRKS